VEVLKCQIIKLLSLPKKNNFWILLGLTCSFLGLIIGVSNFNYQNTDSLILKNGDLLFQDLDSSPLCDAIEKVTSGFDNLNFSHVGIITIIENEKYVLEAFSNGVDTVHLSHFLNRNLNSNNKPKVIVGRLHEEYSKLIPKAVQKGMSLIGKGYDEEFKINNNRFYCSELIYDIFLDANNNNPFFYLHPMTYKYNGETLDTWLEYFKKLDIPIPENEPGINPGGISLSKKLTIIHNYMD